MNAWVMFTSTEVEICFVVIERESVGTAVLGQDGQDGVLLSRREFVHAMMIAVVGTVATTEVVLDGTTCLCL